MGVILSSRRWVISSLKRAHISTWTPLLTFTDWSRWMRDLNVSDIFTELWGSDINIVGLILKLLGCSKDSDCSWICPACIEFRQCIHRRSGSSQNIQMRNLVEKQQPLSECWSLVSGLSAEALSGSGNYPWFIATFGNTNGGAPKTSTWFQ